MSRVLIVLGIGMILYAVFMDTTVSSGYGRVHNIGLQADRQLYLMLGAFIVLVGVILFSVLALKKTPEQEAAELMARRDAVRPVKIAASRTAESSLNFLEAVGPNLTVALDDNLSGRLVVGVFVALCTLTISSLLVQWWVLPVIVLLYALRGRPACDLMRTMLRFNVAQTLLLSALFLIMSPGDSYISIFLIVQLVCAGISIAGLRYLKRSQISTLGAQA